MALLSTAVAVLSFGVATAFAPAQSAWSRSRVSVRAEKALPKDLASLPGKRDANGYLLKSELTYDLSGTDVSTDLGASLGTYFEPPEAVKTFLAQLKEKPESMTFEGTMAMIEAECEYMKKSFSVNGLASTSDQNQGSCKILSFARLVGLDKEPIEVTLPMFGAYYFKDVLENPGGDDHANIRGAMKGGWESIVFRNGLSISFKSTTFGIDTSVDEMLGEANVIEGGEGWDPDGDCWIP